MTSDGSFIAYMMGMIGTFLVFGIGMYLVSSFFMMKLFEKAGVQDQWRAWVPVYNTMILFKLGDLSPWLVLYALAGTALLSWIGIGALFSVALFVLSAFAAWRVGLKLGKESTWVILYVFLSIVWLGIVALDKARWNPVVPPAPWTGNSLLEDKTIWEGIPVQPQQVFDEADRILDPREPREDA